MKTLEEFKSRILKQIVRLNEAIEKLEKTQAYKDGEDDATKQWIKLTSARDTLEALL